MDETTPIATFMNEERTRSFRLQVDGVLIEMSREKPSDLWSPPREVAQLQGLNWSDAAFSAFRELRVWGHGQT